MRWNDTLRRGSGVLGTAVMLLSVFAAPSAGAQVAVDCGADSGALGPAVANARARDRIVISGSCEGFVVITKDLTLVGRGKDPTLLGRHGSDGNNQRVLRIEPGATLRIRRLNVRPFGYPGDVDIVNHGTLKIHASRIVGGPTTAIRSDGSLSIAKSVLRGMHTMGNPAIINTGTAVMAKSRIVDVRNSEHTACILNTGRMTIKKSVVARCIGWIDGGVSNGGRMTIQNSRIIDNAGERGSGGISNSGRMTIRNSEISGNLGGTTSGGEAGGINNTGSLTLRNVDLNDNSPVDCIGC